MKLHEAIGEFKLANQANGLKPATIKWYDSLLHPLAAAMPDELESITTKLLRQYIVDLQNRHERYTDAPQKPAQAGGLSEATIAGHIRALHTFFAWCADEYEITNPMKRIKRQKYTLKPKSIDAADFVKLFEATLETQAGTRDRAILAFLADTGCRLGGLLSLSIDRLQPAQRRALVHEKGNVDRIVYFTTYTQQLLQIWLDSRPSTGHLIFCSVKTGQPLTESGVHQLLTRLKQRASVKGRINPHAFRHRFAIAYLQNGGDLASLAKLLGHTDITTTAMYYAVFSRDELAELHGKFTPMRNFRGVR